MKSLLLILFLLPLTVTAQSDSLQHPYQRFPGFPPVRLLKMDSTSFFTKEDLHKKKPVLLILFNPQCEHCQQQAKEMVKQKDLFKNIQVVMSTTMPFDSMKVFYNKYQLSEMKDLVIGRDTQYFLPTFFHISNLPFLAFYDKKKKLIKVFEGAMAVPLMAETLD